MESLIQDLRQGARTLLKKPGFALLAVIVIAVGIGANTAIFSVTNAVLLRPLPYKDSDRIVTVWANLHRENLEKVETSVPEFFDYKDRSESFEQVAAYGWQGFNLTGGGQPERIVGSAVSPSLFPLLGVEPQLGRAFAEGEDQPGQDQVVLISDGLWKRRFGASTDAIGKTIQLNGRPFTIIGVMPAGFQFPYETISAWKPIVFSSEDRSEAERGSHVLNVIARIKPGVTIERAQSEMDKIAAQIADEHAKDYGQGFSLNLVSLHEEIVGRVRLALLVLVAAVGFVLLIACANVANLLLARAASRKREIAIRAALGASRARIIRHLLTESLLLALAGGITGLLLAMWGVDLLSSFATTDIPRLIEIQVEGRALVFTILITFLTGILFGLAPALQLSKPDLNESLKEGGRSASESSASARLRGLLVVAEIALALVLMAGAGLMIKSFIKLTEVSPGFKPENVLSMRIVLNQDKYSEGWQKREFFNQLLEQVSALPAVERAGVVSDLPLADTSNNRNITIEGRADEVDPTANYIVASANYFSVMGMSIIKGRQFTEADDGKSVAAIVNESFARRLLAGEEALGKRFKLGGQGSPFPWMSIVGIVGDVKHQGLDKEVKPEMYVPYRQTRMPGFPVGAMFLVVRANSNPESLIAAVRKEVLELDKDQPLANVEMMGQRLSRSIAPRRFNMALLTVFGGVALLLAVVGIYGVMSYSVAERTHEIGIRQALGARSRDIFKMVLGKAMALAAAGVMIGLIASLALTRLMASLLFDVAATDALTFVIASLVLVITALGASFVPARRATKVDPMEALRYE